MDNDLALHLAQRAEILASVNADLSQLRRHDRALLSALEHGVFASPLADREVSDEALRVALAEDFSGTILMLEARARIWSGDLLRTQHRLIDGSPEHGGNPEAAWWLATHYPSLPCPREFPEDWEVQVWAARALHRRGMGTELPSPWQDWSRAMAGEQALQKPVEALWALSGGSHWQLWLAPLLAAAEHRQAATLINWLMSRVDDQAIIEAMGLSCQSRFIPWLMSMQNSTGLADPAEREIQWLTGGETDKPRQEERQCWGAPVSADTWPQLFRRLPLAFRGRLWHWCGDQIEGAATSLQGGQWCAGN